MILESGTVSLRERRDNVGTLGNGGRGPAERAVKAMSALMRALVVLSLTGLSGAAAAAEGAPATTFVLLIDRSGSITHDYSSGSPVIDPDWVSEVVGARERARSVLLAVEANFPQADVHLVGFGEGPVEIPTRGTKRPSHGLRFIKRAVKPSEALTALDEAFSTEEDTYGDQQTWIAWSVWRAVGDVLQMDVWTPTSEMPTDRGAVHVLVFTDGDESVTVANRDLNVPYLDWLNNSGGAHLQWRRWPIGEIMGMAAPELSPPDQITYRVVQGPASRATANSAAWPEPPILDVRWHRDLWLTPDLVSADGSHDVLDADGKVQRREAGLACDPRVVPTDKLEASAARDLQVQAVIQWPGQPADRSGAATDEWTLRAPARAVERVTVDSLPTRRISGAQLRVSVTSSAPIPLPMDASTVSEGDSYPVQFDQDALCKALIDAYPNSLFVFPEADAQGLPRLGTVEVYHRPTYSFTLSAEGGDPGHPLGDDAGVRADRLHRYGQVDRTFRLESGNPEVAASFHLRASALRKGEPLEDSSQLIALTAGDASGSELRVMDGEPVTLVMPAEPQTWREATPLGHFDLRPGPYKLRVCLDPRIERAPKPDMEMVIVCPDCGEAWDAESQCLTVDARLRRRPLWSWPRVALTLAALAILLWFVIRWRTRNEFDQGFIIGKLADGDLRMAHAAGAGGAVARFRRKPLYLILSSTATGAVDATLTRPLAEGNSIIGVKPEPGGVWLWAVHVTDHPHGGDWLTRLTPSWTNVALKPHDGKDPGLRGETPDDQLVFLSYSEVTSETKVVLQIADGSKKPLVWQPYWTYEVVFVVGGLTTNLLLMDET